MPAPNEDLQRFVATVDALLAGHDLHAFWSCQSAFRQLLAGSFAQESLNSELRTIVDTPSYLGNWRPRQLGLHEGQGYSLALAVLEDTRRYIHSTPFLGMYAPIAGGSLSYQVFSYPENYRNAEFDAGVKLQHVRDGHCTSGEILPLEGEAFTYHFPVERPTLVVKFTTAPFDTLEWLFDRKTWQAVRANDAALQSTQLRVAAHLLARLKNPSSIEPLQLLTRHPSHVVRWAAIQNLARLAPAAGLDALAEARRDAHPHIRHAAEKTLGKTSSS